MEDNLEIIKQKIYQQIESILLSEDLTEEEKQDLFDQAFEILSEKN